MFDRSHFEGLKAEQLADFHFARFYRGLHYDVHPQFAFNPPDSEQMIRITRAPKEAGDNGLKFWINAEHLDDWDGRTEFLRPYLSASEFRSITEEEFNRAVAAQALDLIAPLQLPLHQPVGFVGGLAMHTIETDFMVSLFAEYEDEFIHFFWETSA
ncbi:MAG: hypothetical protein NVV69_18745 [Methyloversatilis sp.]|uniref:hypothetical protein n=1 Tax=Methyloversatilis sp. TaxID=2569862 RepID=UPI0026007306|nr:hypothetical protein [Methyloversatilis sp.]MCR6667999.1 hypothetical protein [Methyloversatilis sp.]